jgi:hypothetical protein
MTLLEAVTIASRLPTLNKALALTCLWESKRVIEQPREDEKWETWKTGFELVIEETTKTWNKQQKSCHERWEENSYML